MQKRMNVCSVVLISSAFALFPVARPATEATTKNPEAVEVTKGKQIYKQKCKICHYSASTTKKIGPGLAGLMKREKFRNGMKANDENLRRVIERGGKNMPGAGDSLKNDQLRELIAYVKTL